MPVHLDLAQFPRLQCRRCGLVALVDPELPADVRPAIRCPTCHLPLRAPRLVVAGTATAGAASAGGTRAPAAGAAGRARPEGPVPGRPRAPETFRGNRPLPSNLAVGLTLSGILLVLLFAGFLFLLLTPHHPYWEYLTR